MSELISNHFELVDACRSAGLWYVGSYMLEFLMRKEQWENPETKQSFIRYMFTECGDGVCDKDIAGTRTRVNAIIRIIESRKVEDALELVLEADDSKLGCTESKVNAKETLARLRDGRIRY